MPISNNTRNLIKDYLLQECSQMELKRGVIGETAVKFGVDRSTIRRVWKIMKHAHSSGVPINVMSKQIGNKIPKAKLDVAKFKLIEREERHTIRQAAEKYKSSPASIWRMIKRGDLKNSTSHLHPALTDEHLQTRLKFCIEALELNQDMVITFKDMTCIVHIDEKWFWIKKIDDRYILLPEEDTPYRDTNNKNFITKVMFMCAVARPIFGEDGTLIFDGKIGMWPFIEQVEAQRNSRNRPRGTLENRPIPSITREVMMDMIVNKVIPAIKSKWPVNSSKNIVIQQDNAKPHVRATDAEFMQAATSDGFSRNTV